MRIKILYFFQKFWNLIWTTLPNKCGELKVEEDKTRPEVIERDIVINNMSIHIKSIFTGKTNLDKALKNIVVRKISEARVDH